MDKKKMNINVADFKKDLKDLLIKYNATIGVDVDGDTHGITTHFVVVDDKNKSKIISHYQTYIDASDL